MALSNEEVLSNLKEQLKDVERNYFKILGAIDVLEQIENSKVEETTETGTVEVVDNEVERN